MKTRIGNHIARRAAANEEPSPVTGLRDMLATAFAADIVAVTPMVCEVLRAEINAQGNAATREVLRNALVVLARQSGELAFAIIGEVRARFDAKIVPGDDPLAKTSRLSLAQMSLVDDAELSVEIALDQCAARLREQTAAEIFQLTARVCEMLGRESLSDAENPILPRLFARALIEAIAKIGLDPGAKLAVFKAYGPALLHIAPDLYAHANGLLAERGVLAGFTAQYGRPVFSKSPQPARRPEPVIGDEKALAGLLERLLDGERARGAREVRGALGAH